MSDPVEIALIGAAATTLTGLIVGGITLLTKRLERLEVKVDGRLTELLSLTRKSSHAEGVLEGEKNGKESKC
jgi:hypothetical protein